MTDIRVIEVSKLREPEGFNSRQVYDEAYIKGLADSIKASGLMNPLTVTYDAKTDTYPIVAGFCRHKALQLLESKTCAVSIRVPESDLDIYLDNLAENVQRENLKAWEVAERCVLLRDKFGLSGDQIAKKLGKSKSHVNNLMRLPTALHKDIYAALKKNDSATNLAVALSVAAVKDHDEQLAKWKAATGIRTAAEETGTAEDGGSSKGKGKGPTRASAVNLALALAAAREDKEHGKDWRDGVIHALRYAVGEIKTMPIAPPKDEDDDKAEKASKKPAKPAKKPAKKG